MVQKKYGLIATYFYKKMADPIARYLVKNTDITPNCITLFGFLLRLLASAMFVMGNRFLLIGGLLTHVGFTFDYIDGQVARLKKLVSEKGMFLDALTDRISVALLIMSLSIGSYRSTEKHFILIFGIIAISLIYFNDISEVLFVIIFKKYQRSTFVSEINFVSNLAKIFKIDTDKILIGFGEDFIYFSIGMGGIFNQIELLLLFLIMSQSVILIFVLYRVQKKVI